MQDKGERTENKVQSHPQMMTCDTIFCDNCTLVSFTHFATFTPYVQLISAIGIVTRKNEIITKVHSSRKD